MAPLLLALAAAAAAPTVAATIEDAGAPPGVAAARLAAALAEVGVAIAPASEADVVIAGKAAVEVRPGGGRTLASARLSVRAVRRGSGELAAAFAGEATVEGAPGDASRRALEELAAQAAEALAPALADPAPARLVLVKVRGPGAPPIQDALERALGGAFGVEHLARRGRAGGVLLLDVTCRCTGDELGDALEGALGKRWSLRALAATPRTLELAATSR